MAETEQVKTPKRGVGSSIREQLVAGKDNATILAVVKKEFPESNTTSSTVSWYRNDARKKGEKVPTAKDAADAAKAV